MSQLTHPRTQIVDLKFRARTWLVALAAIVVLAVPTALIVSSGDDSATTNQASANGQLRYDGGPNEGTRGISAQPASQPSSERSLDVFGLRP